MPVARLRRLRGEESDTQESLPGQLAFVCNICAKPAVADLTQIVNRGTPTCAKCKSSLRFRSLIAALQERLFGCVIPLTKLETRKDLAGLGMSDVGVYSRLLEEKFNYTNTFFHTPPLLDITNPPPGLQNRFDFVVSSDVMEHVAPPIEIAFRNLRSLLRPRGLLVLTVPFNRGGETVEHFPHLHQFEIIGGEHDRQLINITRTGERQTFRNLVFHDGLGATLEMRLFSESDLLKLLRSTGFSKIQIRSSWFPQWGIVHFHPFSLPITAIAF